MTTKDFNLEKTEMSIENEHLIEEQHGNLTVLTMNRPESLNAFSPNMMAGLDEALPRLADDPECRVLMLTGQGRAFSAGGDVKGFAANSGSGGEVTGEIPSKQERAQGLRNSTRLVELLHTMPKPTIAAIPGVVAGGALGVALSCDLRVASSKSRFTTAFNKLGLSGDYGGTYFLTQLVGPAKAKELFFSSDIFNAETALSLGIVNQVYEADTFRQDALDYATHLAEMPPISTSLMKANLNASIGGTLSDVLDLEAINMMDCFQTNDHKIGARSFVTKEKPVFMGN